MRYLAIALVYAYRWTVSPVLGLPGSVTTTPVSNAKLWGNVYGQAHGGVCGSGS